MSLLIGEHIQESLSANKDIAHKVGDRIFPIVATGGSPSYPFIIFDSSTAGEEDTKDGSGDDRATVSINVFAKSYSEAIHIAYWVKKELRSHTADYAEFAVEESRFLGSQEDYSDDLSAYVINLNFEFITSEL